MEHLEQIKKEQFLSQLYVNQPYRYEFTVTYNPKFIDDIEYANTMTDFVIKDVFKLARRHSKVKDMNMHNTFWLAYVVEEQSNGYPHIHGLLATTTRIRPSTLFNWEQSFYRKYGRTQVYSTGVIDKQHKNDHFEGTWMEYLEKEKKVNYYSCYDTFTDNTDSRITEFK